MKLKLRLGKYKDIWKRFSGHGVYPHELSFLLETPLRKFIISPSDLANRLHISNEMKVLEIGSGPGYFSHEISRRIKNGFLVSLDLQLPMLMKCRDKINKSGILNSFLVQGNAAALPFKPNSFDVVYLVTVLGEISEPEKCILSVNYILREGGILSITEMKGDSDFLSIDEIVRLVSGCNFEFHEKFSSKKGLTINFIKTID